MFKQHVKQHNSATLVTKPQVIEAAFAEQVLKQFYQIEKVKPLTRLIGERDQNFLVEATNRQQYVLKFIHSAEEEHVTHFQTDILRYLNQPQLALPVQPIIANVKGEYDFKVEYAGETRSVRLVSYVDGLLYDNVPKSAALKYQLGLAAGQITSALMEFSHPGQEHVLLWDIKHAGLLRPYMSAVSSPAQRALLERAIDIFECNVLPIAGQLRQSVIHNDLNDSNIVVSTDNPHAIAAILDFGDAVKSFTVNDLAVGATYQFDEGADFLAGVLAFISGYTASFLLTEIESERVFDLMITRLFMRIVIPEWRAQQFPDNRDYILRHVTTAWFYLEKLLTPAIEVKARNAIKLACKREL